MPATLYAAWETKVPSGMAFEQLGPIEMPDGADPVLASWA